MVILHNIRSLHNVGSIFRTSDAAGISKIFLCGITPSPLDRFGTIRPELSKVALGAERNVPWEHIVSTTRCIKKLKTGGYSIYALEQSKHSVSYDSAHLRRGKKKIALVLGDEVRGIPPSILKLSDAILEIPMRGKKESLNVSVAFGIAIFSFCRKLKEYHRAHIPPHSGACLPSISMGKIHVLGKHPEEFTTRGHLIN